MADKMILVPSEALERLKGTNTNLNTLDKEMSQLLKHKGSDAEKWEKYNQLLQRFIHFKQEERRPVKLPIKESQVVDEMKQRVLETLPPTYRTRAEQLYNIIKQSSIVNWAPDGELMIDGTIIQGSNVVDLIGDIMRQRKNIDPIGWADFTKALKRINIPEQLIGNKTRLKYFRLQRGSGRKRLTSTQNRTCKVSVRGGKIRKWHCYRFTK